jgi:hypothetical protein
MFCSCLLLYVINDVYSAAYWREGWIWQMERVPKKCRNQTISLDWLKKIKKNLSHDRRSWDNDYSHGFPQQFSANHWDSKFFPNLVLSIIFNSTLCTLYRWEKVLKQTKLQTVLFKHQTLYSLLFFSRRYYHVVGTARIYTLHNKFTILCHYSNRPYVDSTELFLLENKIWRYIAGLQNTKAHLFCLIK